jgi:hypothetical protein
MLFRLILYVMAGYFVYRVVQFAGRMRSPGRREGSEEHIPPAEPHVPDYKDIKDADFIDITPRDKGADPPKAP